MHLTYLWNLGICPCWCLQLSISILFQIAEHCDDSYASTEFCKPPFLSCSYPLSTLAITYFWGCQDFLVLRDCIWQFFCSLANLGVRFYFDSLVNTSSLASEITKLKLDLVVQSNNMWFISSCLVSFAAITRMTIYYYQSLFLVVLNGHSVS